jgi:hypothetical protein
MVAYCLFRSTRGIMVGSLAILASGSGAAF